MKLRTSFFNTTVLRKNIARFAPAWGIYLIGGILVMTTLVGGASAGDAAYMLGTTIGPFAVLNMIYALICAQLLFGDLFNARLCNALHAMPLPREGWFVTNTVSGLLFSLVPHLIGVGIMLTSLEQYGFIGFIWLLGMALEFLFFFGLAAFCAMCTGSRFAMTAVYGLANFLPLMAYWFLGMFYEPLLYGVVLREAEFARLCPVVWLTDREMILTRHSYSSGFVSQYTYLGLSEDWAYLAVLGVLGAGLLAAALLLYRKRDLENAGNFMAVRFLKPVFSLIITLCAGAVFSLFGAVFSLFGTVLFSGYQVFLILGMMVGYFCGQMLLQRTVKVFKPKAFLRLVILVAVIFGSLLLTKLDVFGIAKWVPQPEHVEYVAISPSRGGSQVILRETEQIRKITQLHETLAEAGEPQRADSYLRIIYRLRSGATEERLYRVSAGSDILKSLQQELSKPQIVLNYTGSWEDYIASVEKIRISGKTVPQEQLQGLLEAIRADCEAGRMAQAGYFYSKGEKYLLEITVGDTARTIRVYSEGVNTIQWIKLNMGI